MQTIYTEDRDIPLITAPSTTQYDCVAGIVDTNFSVSDPCGRISNPALRNRVTASMATLVTPCSTSSPDVLTRTYFVNDGCGNMNSATQVFSRTDTVGPSFNAPPTWTSPSCQSISASLFPNPSISGRPTTASDACTAHDLGTNYAFTSSDAAGSSTSCRATGIRTWYTQDSCGNQSTRTQEMNVVDSTPPQFVPGLFPPSTDVACTVSQTAPTTTDAVFFFPAVTDDCQVPALTYSDVVTTGCNSEIRRTWYINDNCNPQVPRTQVVTRRDATPPTIEDLPDVVINCSNASNGQTAPTAPFGNGRQPVPTVADACDLTPSLTFSDVPFGNLCPDSQLVVRTWLATDDCLNTSTDIVNIRIVLDQQPTLTVPRSTSINCEDGTLPAVGSRVGTATASQVCDVKVTVTYQDILSFNICPETIQRVWIATDECLNQVTELPQIISVTDNQRPQFLTIPPSITINCEDDTHPGQTGFPLVSDNCDFPVCSITWYDDISDVGEPVGTCKVDQLIRRTFVARDFCENASTITQDIFVEYVEVSVPCDGLPCAQNPCKLCECDLTKLNCECCERGGAASCLPVNCNAVACSPKANCNPVPCIACALDIGDSTSPLPFCDNSTVPCIPNIIPIFVDDEDSTAIPDPEEGEFDSEYWKDRAVYWRDRLHGEQIQAASTSQLAPLIALLVLLLSLPFTFYAFLLN